MQILVPQLKPESRILEGLRRQSVKLRNKRARRDKAKRDALIEKAQQLVNAPAEKISQRGARRYVKPVGSEYYELHTDKIREDAKWDGFYGIYTNNLDLRLANYPTALPHALENRGIIQSIQISFGNEADVPLDSQQNQGTPGCVFYSLSV